MIYLWIASTIQTRCTTCHLLHGTGILTVPIGYVLYIPIAVLMSLNKINEIISTDLCLQLDLISPNGLPNKIKTIKSLGMPIKLAKLQTLDFKNL